MLINKPRVVVTRDRPIILQKFPIILFLDSPVFILLFLYILLSYYSYDYSTSKRRIQITVYVLDSSSALALTSIMTRPYRIPCTVPCYTVNHVHSMTSLHAESCLLLSHYSRSKISPIIPKEIPRIMCVSLVVSDSGCTTLVSLCGPGGY